jgi:hypothetical protein
LHVIPDAGINDLPDWQREWSKPGTRIVDEYGDEVPTDQMLGTITELGWTDGRFDGPPPGHTTWPIFHDRNHSFPGPRGLLRHRVDGVHCVGNGEGTWDLIAGDFS